MTLITVVRLSAVTAAILLATGATRAESKAEIDIGIFNTMSLFFAQDAANRELAAKAAGILVFPRIRQRGAGSAGDCGQGALLVDGHPVAYYSIGATASGAAAGPSQRSEVLLFMTQGALEAFRNSHDWVVGANARVAVVTKGAGAQYDTRTLRKPILAFLFGERGLIGTRSIDGERISMKSS